MVQERSVESRRWNEALFRGIYETSSVGFALLDFDGRTVDINPACKGILDLFDLPAESLLECVGAPSDAWERVTRGEVVRFQSSVRLGRGSVRSEHAIELEVQILPFQVPDSLHPRAYLAQISDISEQKRVERALRDSEELFHRVLDLTDAGVARFDLGGRRTFVNEALARRLGKPAEVLLQGTIGDHVVLEDRLDAERLFRQCVETGRPIRGIVSGHNQGGRSFWTRSDFTPIFTSDGQMIGVQSTSVDITELIETQEYLRYALIERDRLHEITREMIKVLEMDKLLQMVCKSVCDAVGARMVWVGLTDRRSEDVLPVAVYEAGGSEQTDQTAEALQDRIRAAEANQCGLARQFRLLFGDEMVGVLTVHCDAGQTLDDERASEVEIFADAAALAIRNARLFEEATSARALLD
ncbi:MAG: PAS domain S-box protein [Chloroflexi bacterium]|nr:PAS domain S-box protein [Chloroflexota bacterium]